MSPVAAPTLPDVAHDDRRRLPRAQRERQILQAAHAEFAQRGFQAVTMDDIAARVGVTKPLLYAYFRNKEHLYIACMRPSGDALLAAVARAIGSGEDPVRALRAGVHAVLAFLDADRDAWRVLFDESLPTGGEIAAQVGDYRRRLCELVVSRLADGLPEPRSQRAVAEITALSHAVLGACEAIAGWWLSGGGIATDEAAELLISTLEPGLRARVLAGRCALGTPEVS